tara:strand:- start:54 stop:737 length:684 start_codon:yes stop_codon:yes gene_type:complete
MNRTWSLKKKKNKIIYNILNINENTKDKDCINADTNNEKKYQSVMKKAGQTSKLWDNTGVTMNIDVPSPPKPNNYDRLLDFRKKNVLRPSIQQSNATIYLYNKGYVLGKDYEAYQAIEIHNKLINIEEEDNLKNEMLEDKKKPNTIKDLSLLDKIPIRKNIYPDINVEGNKKILNGWERNSFYQPCVEVPKPSAPPAPALFEGGYNTFKKMEKRYNSNSSDDSHFEF